MKKADPVSSKSLYRCLRVLDVFVHLYYSKKDPFCQEFYGIHETQGLCKLLIHAKTQESIVQIGRN